ncbi:MAG: hypothetical protein ACFFCH_05525 [Promethearchaeota archaeon]
MKPKTKKILLLGIGLTFLFAMVIVPMGVAIAIRPTLLPRIGPGPGIPEIVESDPFSGYDWGFLGWDGTYASDAEFTILPK